MNILVISNPNLYILIILSVVNVVFMCFVVHKFLQIMQISGYNVKKYFNWVKDTKAKWISRIAFLSLLCFISMFVCNVLFRNFGDYELFTYVGLVFYFWFMVVYIVNMKNVPEKKKLVITRRVVRIYLVLSLFMAAITFGLFILSFNLNTVFRFSLVAITPILLPVLLPFVVILLKPLEKLIALCFIKKSKRKLKNAEPIIKIGITGSFGKTSTKNFLTDMLKKKYEVLCTPESYNTPMGICKTINKGLKKDTQVFVCEMGADHVGDIKKICNMVKPDIAVITALGNQHLQTFGTYENIEKTKYEIVQSLNENGIAYFNTENENVKKLFNKSDFANKYSCSFQNENVRFENVEMTKTGLKFNLFLNGKKHYCKTKILGMHNLQNIMVATNIAFNLGVEYKDIIDAIVNLKPVYHRLELKQAENGIIVIDDSFNSNVEGSDFALQTLKMFTNNRKIVVSPGLVEMGEIEKQANVEFGERIAQCADVCIIVNKYNSEAIRKGLENKGFNKDNIYEVESLFLATELFKKILKKGDVILLENDLPDNYR